MFQHKDIEEIEKVLNNNFENICDWFVDNKLSIHFGEDKTKPILFASQHKIRNIKWGRKVSHILVPQFGTNCQVQ